MAELFFYPRCLEVMDSSRILLGLTLLLAASAAAGDGVDHYEVAPSVLRASGQTIYPPGVTDPSLANPPGPPPESAIPGPAANGLPIGTTPTGAPVWSPGGPASPGNTAPGPAYAGASGPPPIVQPPVYQSATQIYPATPAAPAAADAEQPASASWYTRVEYFHWRERTGGTDFVNEDGTLFTLGYSRKIGSERFRAELFGGDVHYAGYDQSTTTTDLIPLSSNTGYLGLRGEYEIVFTPPTAEGRVDWLAGMGTRFWIRDLHDGTDDQGNAVWGYQETWWTMYPYVGMETHVLLGNGLDFYSQSRVGATLLTYEFASINQRPLWPKTGILANTEIGFRGQRFFIAARAEVMSWTQSSVVEDSFQPNSLMLTAGGRLGFVF